VCAVHAASVTVGTLRYICGYVFFLLSMCFLKQLAFGTVGCTSFNQGLIKFKGAGGGGESSFCLHG
jgi:hypothetical protein